LGEDVVLGILRRVKRDAHNVNGNPEHKNGCTQDSKLSTTPRRPGHQKETRGKTEKNNGTGGEKKRTEKGEKQANIAEKNNLPEPRHTVR